MALLHHTECRDIGGAELFGPVEHSSLLGVRKRDAWRAEKKRCYKMLDER
jgi:hypothetical protein